MSFFGPDDNLEEQYEIYDRIVQEKEQEIAALPGKGQSVAIDQHRQDLQDQIYDAQLSRAQVLENAEREGRDVSSYEYDQGFFGE